MLKLKLDSKAEFDELIQYWVDKLFLTDWIIVADLTDELINDKEESGDDSDNYGLSYINYLNKEAKIYICNAGNKESLVSKCPTELTIIHELLHLVQPTLIDATTADESRYEMVQHSNLEQLAKSLLMVKYNLDFSWFKKEIDYE